MATSRLLRSFMLWATASPADCVSPTAALFGVQPASMEMPKTAARRPAAARRAKPVIVWLS